MKKSNKKERVSFFNRFLNTVEKVGNKLPHPITLFALFALGIILLSALAAMFGFSATGELVNRVSGTVEMQTIAAKSLLNGEGIVYILTSAVSNFTSFAPLGTVLVAMLGVGVAEYSGFVPALLKGTVKVTPKKLITPVVVFLGIMSNVASDAGYVVLIPIGALMFMAYDRHPIAGLAAAFAGVSGGFSANLIIGTLDPLLAGITNEAIRMIDPNYTVQPTGNWYFMFVSTFLITILGTIITDKVVEPRLAAYSGNKNDHDFESHNLSKTESKALRNAGITILLLFILMLAATLPQNSFLRNGETGSLIRNSPLMESVIVLIALAFFIPSVVYGFSAGVFTKERDVGNALGKAMSSMGSYIALAFMSAQFIKYFDYTRLGTIIALKGANFFKTSGISAIPLMFMFIIFSSFINLFMGSASAKWTILAPVFVPMFMLLGYTPELTQVAFRIGDSCTNLITPLMSYFAMIVVFAKKYDDKAGVGTLIATMLPYSITFMLGWFALLIIWVLFALPLGPEAFLTL